jgi:hypothetical protein
MDTVPPEHDRGVKRLIVRPRSGNHDTLSDRFDFVRDRDGRAVELRMEPRLRARRNSHGVLVGAYLDATRDLTDDNAEPNLKPLLRLRLHDAPRPAMPRLEHSGAGMSTARQVTSLEGADLRPVTCVALPSMLQGR